MEQRPARVLVADLPDAARTIAAALTGLRVTPAHTLDEAVEQLREVTFDLVVVGYHFDELHPFRLIQYVRDNTGITPRMPIILIRTLPLLLGPDNVSDIRVAYKEIGADEFVSLYDDHDELGADVAVERFRALTMRLLGTQAPP